MILPLRPASVVELLVYVWAACKYLVFTVQGPGTPVCFLLLPWIFFFVLYECIALPSVFELLSYLKLLCKVFLFLFFFVLLTEEFRFPVHAWVCRYYTYVRVFVNVHTMRFAILLHRQAFMYIHVHVLRGFQTYILLFSNLFSSASFFFGFCFAFYCCNCIAVSVHVCL